MYGKIFCTVFTQLQCRPSARLETRAESAEASDTHVMPHARKAGTRHGKGSMLSRVGWGSLRPSPQRHVPQTSRLNDHPCYPPHTLALTSPLAVKGCTLMVKWKARIAQGRSDKAQVTSAGRTLEGTTRTPCSA